MLPNASRLLSIFLYLGLAALAMGTMPTIPPLPSKLIVGYASWGQCDELLLRSCGHGVNVIIWFSIDLAPYPARGPDIECTRRIATAISEAYPDVVHLISIGGWNAPHIATNNTTPEEVYSGWKSWNENIVAGDGFGGFHGIDWDLEGNDTPEEPTNVFTVDTLDFMGRFSQLAKADGYIVSMAPAQSYLDPTTSEFSRSLKFMDPKWEEAIPGLNFAYHGKNVYAYLIARYGIETFDFVTIQLYEGYSHAMYAVSFGNVKPSDMIVSTVDDLVQGWKVNFDSDEALGFPAKSLAIPRHKIVIGLANGWAGDGKFLLVQPDELQTAYLTRGKHFRGYAFWNVKEEGLQDYWLVPALNKFMHIRPTMMSHGLVVQDNSKTPF